MCALAFNYFQKRYKVSSRPISNQNLYCDLKKDSCLIHYQKGFFECVKKYRALK